METDMNFDPFAAFARLPELVDADPFLVHRGRYTDMQFFVGIGDVPFIVTVEKGRVARVERGPFHFRSWDFAIRGTEEGWRLFWEPVPPPQSHDILALAKRKAFHIEGNLHKFMANLLYIKDVLASPRRKKEA